MLNSLSDMRIWYPFLPIEDGIGLYDLVCTHIKDMLIEVPLTPGMTFDAVDSMKADLMSIHTENGVKILDVHVLVGLIVDSVFEVPCYSTLEQVNQLAGSFAVVDDGLQDLDNLVIPVHPDCISIEMIRDEASECPLSFCAENGRVMLTDMKFTDGYNVGVSFKDGTIVFDAKGGNGLGFYNIKEKVQKTIERLRNPSNGIEHINGLTKNVSISVSPVIKVTVTSGKADKAWLNYWTTVDKVTKQEQEHISTGFTQVDNVVKIRLEAANRCPDE